MLAAPATATTPSAASPSAMSSPPQAASVQQQKQQQEQSTAQNIDSALCAGMKDPRERAALFRLEVCYQDFCKSSSSWMDVGGAYNRCIVLGPITDETEANSDPTLSSSSQPPHQQPPQSALMLGHQTSFHRLLVHRLADRFGIRRESLIPNTIRLFKGPNTQIPSVLLQNLEPALYYPETSMMTHTDYSYSSSKGGYPSANDNTTTGANNDKPSSSSKKKIIMKKRGPIKKAAAEQRQRDFQNTSRATSSSEQLLEARERAYAEARARIFNEGATASNEEGENDAPTADMAQLSLQPSEGVAANATSASAASTSQDDNKTSSSPGSLSQQQQQQQQVDADRKAVYRNRAEEAADPDFRRGRIRTPMTASAYPYLPQQATPPFPPPPQHHHSAAMAMHPATAMPYPAAAAAAAAAMHNNPKRPTPASSSTAPTLVASAPVFVPGVPSAQSYPHHPKSIPPQSAWGNGAPSMVRHHNSRYNNGQPSTATAWHTKQQQQQQYPPQAPSPRGGYSATNPSPRPSPSAVSHSSTESTTATSTTGQGPSTGVSAVPAVQSS